MNNDILRHVNRLLRERLQACESRQRKAWRNLGTFLEHLIAAGQEVSIQHMAELAGEIAEIRLLLAGAGEGGAV